MSTEDKLKGCVIRLTHIPYGFFDKELLGYFSQFGRVVRARVPKSKTVFFFTFYWFLGKLILEKIKYFFQGRFLNKAYVAFDDPTVARLAAETMENYLMFDKRVRCKVLNGVPKVLRSGPVIAPGFSIDKKKVEYAKKASDYKSEEDINAGLVSLLQYCF